MSDNLYLHHDPDRRTVVSELSNGMLLYEAYYPLRHGERYRRQMGSWNGAEGRRVGVTKDGQLYEQARIWCNDPAHPEDWQRFKL